MKIVVILVAITIRIEAMNNFSEVPCGKVKLFRTAKIVGGQNATEGEFPWLVSLTRRGGHFCGGSVITKNYILSAGHCMCSSGSSLISPNQIGVTIGQHDLIQFSSTKYDVRVISIILHPEYVCGKVRNDLVLLKLEQPLMWSDRVYPACLPTGVQESGYTSFANVLATIAGWGWTNENNKIGSRGNQLQKAKVNIVENKVCQEWYKLQRKKTKIYETQICAGFEQGGIDSCWADSGGPLMVPSKNEDELMIVGVVSTGIGCARPFLPGLYTRLSEYVSWIQSVVNE